MSKINNRRDILLLLLFAPGATKEINEPIVGRTRIVKMLYLFKKELLEDFKKGTDIDETKFYEFFSWNFGPFSTQVYDDLTFFTLRGFISPKPSGEEPIDADFEEWNVWASTEGASADFSQDDSIVEMDNEEKFELSESGIAFVKSELWSLLTPAQKKLLTEFKAKMVTAHLRAILKYVYTRYPEGTDKSLIRDSVLGT